MCVSQFLGFSLCYGSAVPLGPDGNPAPFPPVPNVIKLSMKFQTTQDLDIIVNTHWKYAGSPPVSADVNTWLGAVATGFTNSLQPLCGTNVTHVQDTATDLSSSTGVQVVQTHTQVGSRAGGLLPISAAALFNGKIPRRYRGGKPRNYWPFGTDTDLANSSQWTTTAQTAFQTGINNFIATLVTGPFGALNVQVLVNVGYFHGHKPVQNPVTLRYKNVPLLGAPPTFPAVDTISQYSCNLTLGSQRRRLRPG